MNSSVENSALELVAELHRRQGEMYAGGSVEAVAELLAEDIVWHVPGASPIAGDHRGTDEVIAYLEKRRQLASATMRMHPREAMARPGSVVQFVEGTAELGGRQVSWQTVGAYRVDEEASRVLEVWLVPLDLSLFDELWSQVAE
jgi:uncharacterized protein